jgi:hypothetical protein
MVHAQITVKYVVSLTKRLLSMLLKSSVLIIFLASFASFSAHAVTIQQDLSHDDVATITDDQQITIRNSKDEVIQESTFSCGTVSATIFQLKKIQQDLIKDPKKFMKTDISYPLLWNHDKKHIKIKNAQELDKNFTVIFTKKTQDAIINQDPYRLFANSQGTMIGNGNVWFCKQGIFVVNG